MRARTLGYWGATRLTFAKPEAWNTFGHSFPKTIGTESLIRLAQTVLTLFVFLMLFVVKPFFPFLGFSGKPVKNHVNGTSVSPEPTLDIKILTDQVRQVAYDIHLFHGHGHLEKVYENALAHRLRKLGITVHQQHPLKVYDEDSTLIGDYYADLLVENTLIIELKTAKTLAPEHIAQILGYLKSSRLQHGLLINFGSYKFEIRKFTTATL